MMLTRYHRILPFAAVVTPGSLVVEPRSYIEDKMLKPPQLLYNQTAFVHILGDSEGYSGPSDTVSRLAMATATLGQILQIPSSYQNESYTLEFYGPAIQCTPNTQVLAAIKKNHKKVEDELWLQFVAWVPSDSAHAAPAYNFTANNEPYETIEGPYGAEYEKSKLRLMVASINAKGGNYDGPQLSNLMVHECTLHNASYVADFGFHYPDQTVVMRSLLIHETIVSDDYQDIYMQKTPFDFHSRRLSYKAVMDAFGSIFVGGSYYVSTSPAQLRLAPSLRDKLVEGITLLSTHLVGCGTLLCLIIVMRRCSLIPRNSPNMDQHMPSGVAVTRRPTYTGSTQMKRDAVSRACSRTSLSHCCQLPASVRTRLLVIRSARESQHSRTPTSTRVPTSGYLMALPLLRHCSASLLDLRPCSAIGRHIVIVFPQSCAQHETFSSTPWSRLTMMGRILCQKTSRKPSCRMTGTEGAAASQLQAQQGEGTTTAAAAAARASCGGGCSRRRIDPDLDARGPKSLTIISRSCTIVLIVQIKLHRAQRIR